MKSQILFWSGLCLLIFALASCSGSSVAENQFDFTFEEGQAGWETGFEGPTTVYYDTIKIIFTGE